MKPQYPALVKLSCIVTYAKLSVCHLCGDVTTEYVYKLYELGYAVTQAILLTYSCEPERQACFTVEAQSVGHAGA